METTFSTGLPSLDKALGGGLPRGYLVEIFGAVSTDKTTLALRCITEAQKAGGVAAFVDAEHALDIAYAARLGVNVNDLLVSQPDSGEQALDIVEALTRSGVVDLIVVDSVQGLIPWADIDGGELRPGARSRLLSQALRKLAVLVNRQNATVVFTNRFGRHVADLPIPQDGGVAATMNETLALKYYAAVRIRLEKVSETRIRASIPKNKVAAPFGSAEFDILYEGCPRKERE